MVGSPFLEASEDIAGEMWVKKLFILLLWLLVMFSVRSVKKKTCIIHDLQLKGRVDITFVIETQLNELTDVIFILIDSSWI